MRIYWILKNCTAKPLALSYHILELLWKKCNSNRAWEESHFSPNHVFITVPRVNGCWSEEPVSRVGGWPMEQPRKDGLSWLHRGAALSTALNGEVCGACCMGV